ncbi:MAG: hypothetical protein V3V32_04300 [Dehalococcoidia bacterium]
MNPLRMKSKEKRWCEIHKIYYRPHDGIVHDGFSYKELPAIKDCPICFADESPKHGNAKEKA